VYRISNFYFRYSNTVSETGKSIGPKNIDTKLTKIF
jgi:hypothetical protein